MKYLLLTLSLTLAGCATLAGLPPLQKVVTVLNDAQFGISEACSVQWLTATDCTVATDAITGALQAANASPKGSVAVVLSVLGSVQQNLPAGSKVGPYLAAALAALQAFGA